MIAIIGPTGVGKTRISILLAQRLDGEIVSADSRLLYRGMDIGTAKPTLDERTSVRHSLIDVANPDETWSLAIYQQEAIKIISEIHNRGRVPFLVGGTGQYIRAIINGWMPPTIKPDLRLRASLEQYAADHGGQALHNALSILDPEAAQSIAWQNTRRVIRALEVIIKTGYKFSSQRRQSKPPYNSLIIGLTRPRSELYELIDNRIDEMFASGLITEVQTLLSAGFSPDLPSLSAIGYRECLAIIRGEIDVQEAKRRIRKATRAFIRRQTNWFKPDDPFIHWFDVGKESIDEIETVLLRFIETERRF
ncbi:MAG: tRNA (adenosine(37)-N6)-dimethylallyltransferase MiaA [Chloroflexota bacterium]